MFLSWRPAPIRAPALGLVLSLGLAGALCPGPALALDEAQLKELEGLLRDLGFDPGTVDGVVDDATTEAIRRYQEFALLPGEPEPSARLLDELRGVAAAFAALNADKEKPATPPELPDLGAGTPKADAAPEPQTAPETVAEKVVVPPPPPPPKLKPAEPPEAPQEAPQTAELPPPDVEEPPSETPAPPAIGTQPEPAPAPAVEKDDAAPAEPVDEAQARIDAELVPYRKRLADGSLTREALSRQFNDEGRKLLQQAQYGEAVVKFSVAIQLDPNFAGAYSNRGTAYRLQEEDELAQADFDKAKQLGFGGFRLGNSSNPLK